MASKNVLIFGPPGAGKGTQSTNVAKSLTVPHISTGDMFRYNIKNATELGKKAQEYTNAGKLVPDEITIAMVKDRLQQTDAKEGFLLDGFPRNTSQAKALDEMLKGLGRKIEMVLNLQVPFEDVKARLAKRAAIEGRKDDADPAVIEKRIETYRNESEPCLAYYRPAGVVKDIKGTGSIEEVWAEIEKIIK